jgi:hypothetical protein
MSRIDSSSVGSAPYPWLKPMHPIPTDETVNDASLRVVIVVSFP